MTRIATWNSARDVWETEAVSLLSGRLDVYSETFPISGMTVNGVAYELPTSAHHMDASGSLFSQLGGKLIPTPRASDGEKGGPNQRGSKGDLTVSSAVALLPTPCSNEANGIGRHGDGGDDLRTTIYLMPTPQAHDHVQGKTAEQVRAMRERTGAGVKNLNEVAVNELLPTPKAGDADFGMPRTSGRPPEKSTHLMTRLAHTSPNAMLPTPRATRGGSATEIAYGFGGERSDDYRGQGSVELPVDASWGPYAAAIERWEAVLSRPAPDPTELGPKGGRRLSAAFVEWMMGLPESWVTDPTLGLSRTQQLKMLGNGVVTQQAVTALKSMGVHASGKDL